MGFAAVQPFLPYYVRSLGVHTEAGVLLWSGWLSSGAGIAMAIVAPVWGVLADRHGRKMMVMRSMFGGFLVLALMGLAQNVYQLLALRILQGILTGTVTASVALIASVVPMRRTGIAMGLMQNALFIGGAAGPLIGGVVAEKMGFRLPFEFAAVLVLMGGLLTLFWVHEEFDPDEMENSDDGAMTIRGVLGITGFTTMVGLLFMMQFSGSFVGPILPLYIERISGLHDPSKLAGEVFALGGLTAAISAPLMGLLGDRVGYTAILASCTFGDGLLLIPQGLVRTIHQLIGFRMAFSFCDVGAMPAANAFIRRLVPRHACGKAFGLVQSVTCLGWGLGPAVGSALAARFGMRVPFFIVGGAFLLISVGVMIVLPRMLQQIAANEVAQTGADAACDLLVEEALDAEFEAETRGV